MSLLRDCAPALALALEGGVPLFRADNYTWSLSDGITFYNMTTWTRDLTVGSTVFNSSTPWLTTKKWNVTNTMEVPSLVVRLSATNTSFMSGPSIKQQIHEGLFDGAQCLMSRAFMTSPGDTSALGTINLFGGEVGGIDLSGVGADITIKGKSYKLDQLVPRKVYAIPCAWSFCDVNCGANGGPTRSAFTFPFTVGASPSEFIIPWAVTPPDPTLYINGNVAITSGPGAGQRRTIANADSTGLYPIYPLFAPPDPGDSFTAFQGCDFTFNSGSGRSCTDRLNQQNYEGFEFVPPPNAAY